MDRLKRTYHFVWISAFLCLFTMQVMMVQSTPELKKQGTAKQLIVNGEPFIMLAGELHNSSASNPAYMEPLWEKLAEMNLNTVLAAVGWDQLEPEEGQYNLQLIDDLIQQAKEHNMKLVLLWFGSWKNGVSSYTPDWVKKDLQRFPRILNEKGNLSGVLTPLNNESCQADAKAFSAMMKHIRETDENDQTVLMVQVENEAGLLGNSRDRSPLADKVFTSPVPKELMDFLAVHKETLIPELKKVWDANGSKSAGTWAEVFGNTPDGDEVMMAWYYGRYIGKIAEAGKKEYPLPMYVNAWLVQSEGQQPGRYPSGGPVSKMMDIWRAAAPSIDLYAPDIYLPTFKEVCESYTRNGNPLFIPEISRDKISAARVFYAIAQLNAVCFAPFGIESITKSSVSADNNPVVSALLPIIQQSLGMSSLSLGTGGNASDHPLAESYWMLSSLMPLLKKYQGTGKMIGLLGKPEGEKIFAELGDYKLEIDLQKAEKEGALPGYGLIIALEPDEFLLAGANFSVHPAAKDGKYTEILSIEEGTYEEGNWVPGRKLNGDETGAHWKAQIPPNAGDQYSLENQGRSGMLQMKVYSHP